MYLKSEFEYIFKTTTALEKFLQSFLTPRFENIEIKLAIKFKYSTEDFLPIFKHIATESWERHRIRLQCEEWDPTTQNIMNRAFQHNNLWQGPTPKVESITCGRNNNGGHQPTVKLYCSPYASRQDKDQREKDLETWNELGFAVT